MNKTIYISYVFILIAFFLYSYTQIDLSLTFSRVEPLRELVKSFQYVGFFNRPLSALIYIFLIVFLFTFYIGFLIMAYLKKVSIKTAWKLIFITTIILMFSYNAFSYDLFNYMFDAKIITHYYQNPYLHKALDFPGDPMLSFMHWTHRVYPYGPVWLVLTVPLSFLGFNLFIPTFFLFKSLMAVSYLGTTYYIGKIIQKIYPQNYIWGMLFFALNPLVIIETLISAHLDVVMLFFAAWSLYRIINKKYISAFTLLAISIGIKFATAALLLVYLIIIFQKLKNKKINWEIIFLISLLLMISTVIYVSRITNFQPWYLLEVLFIAALISKRYVIFFPSIIISFFSLLTYAPFLYLGNWDPPVPQIIEYLRLISYIFSIFIVATYFIIKKFRKSKI